MTHDNPHDRAADAVHEGRPVEAQYVRGGRKGSRILMVLIGGLVLVVIAYGLIYTFSAKPLADTNANNGQQAVDAQAFQRDEVPAADAPTTATGQPTSPPTGATPNVNAPTTTAPAQ